MPVPAGSVSSSTIVDLTGSRPTLLRPGGVALEAIEAVVGHLDNATPGPVRAPGMLARHYAPSRPLRLNAEEAMDGEVLLGFGPAGERAALNLSPEGNLDQAAANLFAMLRALDRPGVAAIAVMAIPEVALGRAINDRLRRAATPEPAHDPENNDDWNDDRGPAAPCILPDMGDE